MTWIGNLLFLIGIILIGRKIKWGWIAEAVGECLWVYRSVVSHQWDLLVVCIMFGCLQLYNFWLWQKPLKAKP